MQWDEEKSKGNLRKHNLTFEEVTTVFDDPNCLEIFDEAHSIDEDRYICIGDIGAFVIVVVVFTERDGTIRIITARRANSDEEKMYYEYLQKTLGRN